jgi:hypothetical protein
MALLGLFFEGLMCIVDAFRFRFEPLPIRIIQAFFGFTIWNLFVWKLWTKPRKWSTGLGIFLIVVLAFQIYLWSKGISDPTKKYLQYNTSASIFILEEIPLALSAACCLSLRFLKN